MTDNFSLPEFQSKDGSDFPKEVIENLKEVATNLEVLRSHLGHSIYISSGYRSPSHNSKIGGAKNSMHLKGLAADIKVLGFNPLAVFNAIEALINSGKIKEGGLGLYRSWVHYDIRGTKARWKK
jgi:uncharacterized protein YcbK (DUF882 family)